MPDITELVTTDGHLLKRSGTTIAGVDPATFGGASGVRATKSTTQTLTSATVTAITFDTETYDTDGIHDTVTNNTRFTVPAGKVGKWAIIASAAYTASTGGTVRQARLHLNGIETRTVVAAPTGAELFVTVNDVLDLAAGDYVELYGYHNTGSNLTVRAGAGGCLMVATYLGS